MKVIRSTLLTLLALPVPAPGDQRAPAPDYAPPPYGVMSILEPEKLARPLEADAKPAPVKKGILDLRGPIDSAMRQRFDEAVAAGNVTTVRITSQGGAIADALQIANSMQARELNVIVHDLCAGACAQYIFVAGNQRRVERGSLVGFINTVRSLGTLLSMATQTLEVKNIAQPVMNRFAAIEEEIYRRSGIAASLLLDPHMALQPQCVVVRSDGRRIGWSTTNAYMMWVPTRQYLKSVGVEFEGDWPRSRSSLGSRATGQLKIETVPHIRYGDEDNLRSKKQRPYSLEEVKQCMLEQLPDDAGPAPR